MSIGKNERQFLDAFRSLFVGSKVEGESGFVNLMQFKYRYFQSIHDKLISNIDDRAPKDASFREELFDKLYTFFSRYFCESGSIYFRHLPVFSKTYERVYENDEDVSLQWKTHMLYYVKSDILIRSMPIEIAEPIFPHRTKQFYFDASGFSHAKNNEKREFVYQFKKNERDSNITVHIDVSYSANGKKTNIDKIIKDSKAFDLSVVLSKEEIERAIYIFEKQTEVDYFVNKDANAFLKEQFDLWMFHYIYDENTLFSPERVSQLKSIQDTAYDIINLISQFEGELKNIWEKPKFARNINYVVTLDKLSRQTIKKITAHEGFEAQAQEWRQLGLTEQTLTADTLLDDNKIRMDNGLADNFMFLPLDTRHFSSIKFEIIDEIGDLDSALDGEIVYSDNWQALNTLRKRYAGKIDCIHIDPPYNTKTSGFLYKNEYRHASWLSMMQNRIDFTNKLLKSDGSFLCHIDEHEYERLHLLLEATDLYNTGTIVWDKRNPVSGRKGVATQHEYIIWRSRAEQYLSAKSPNFQSILNTADRIVSKHGEVNDTARSEFQQWICSQKQFSGGERSYCLIDDLGQVYRPVSLSAPEPREDPKFHIPLMHPKTGKPCPVPSNGFSRTPETLKSMLDSDEILFGLDETTQPQQKRILSAGARKMVSSVIQNAKKGKADLDRLGLNFPYCHPVGLYCDLIESAAPSDGSVILDYFAGSGTTGHAVIETNRADQGRRRYLLIEMGDYFHTVLVPRIKKVIFARHWKKGAPTAGSGSSHAFKYFELEQYEETLQHMRYKDSEQLEIDSRKSPFEQYVFFGDSKLSQFIEVSEDSMIKINLSGLYNDIDLAESLSNILGKPIRRVTDEEVVFADGTSEKTNPDAMTESEKLHFISLIKPYIWWGA